MKKSDQGFNPKRFQVIVRTLIFIFHDDKILLLKGAPNKKIWPGKFNGIGGHLEMNEDVLSSAKRELKEETGLTNINLQLRGNIVIDNGDQTGIMLFVYRGEALSTKIVNSDEGQLMWVEMEELDKIDLVEDLKTLIPRVISNEQSVFSGYYHFVNDKLQMEFEN
ncbi:MAG: hypothetical protein BGO78_01260 [Chloroflexi bacterium 44-23]|nr:MAG: hypothetical protein BGO78_01260 [Chloroflexi bacterium 44-23]